MKPKLVLTGRWWMEPYESSGFMGFRIKQRGEFWFCVINRVCYEYQVQQQTEAQNNS